MDKMLEYHHRDAFFLRKFCAESTSAGLLKKYQRLKRAWDTGGMVGALPTPLLLQLAAEFPDPVRFPKEEPNLPKPSQNTQPKSKATKPKTVAAGT